MPIFKSNPNSLVQANAQSLAQIMTHPTPKVTGNFGTQTQGTTTFTSSGYISASTSTTTGLNTLTFSGDTVYLDDQYIMDRSNKYHLKGETFIF